MKCTVKIFDGRGKEVLSQAFPEGTYRLGRSEYSDIQIDHTGIARSSLEIRITEASVYVTNMAATGKLKLNGQRVETGEVRDGDEIKIGHFRIVILQSVQEEGGSFNLADVNGASEEAQGLLPEPGKTTLSPVVTGRTEGSAALKAETLVEVKPVVAKLLFTEGPRAGEEMFLDAFEVTLGRTKKADIYLDDEKLSRLHAKITRVGLGYRLIDLNSRNGTYVNGIRILEHPLGSFDEIQIGSTKIKFLIRDLVSQELSRGNGGLSPLPVDSTRSMAIGALDRQLEPFPNNVTPFPSAPQTASDQPEGRSSGPRVLMLGLVIALGIAFFFIPSKQEEKKAPSAVAEKSETDPGVVSAPLIPKEFFQLPTETQRAIEGAYNQSKVQAEAKAFDQALATLKQIHDVLPYYKDSLVLQTDYRRRYEEQRTSAAQDRARMAEKSDIKLYLEEGMEYLGSGDWDRAAEAFQAALLLDPKNEMASMGLRAAGAKVRRLEDIPPERDPEAESRARVRELFKTAVTAFRNKSYQEAIDAGEQIRKIELKGDTAYLNEAKQIIDQATLLQKEEFEPFLIQAKEKYAEGDYGASRDLCEEMLKRDPSYSEAKDCAVRAKKQLTRLAKEAYTHGYILESMNRLEEAKQYWNRAKNYVRPGDDYYDKVMKKLDLYQ